MSTYFHEARLLADTIESLSEPYRQNTLNWLECCTRQPMQQPRTDLLVFLVGLHPVVRESFLKYTQQILGEAVRYFGVPEGAIEPLGRPCTAEPSLDVQPGRHG
jgi:hypothetical protein